jgi:putative ABC transport system ATP-binding protein
MELLRALAVQPGRAVIVVTHDSRVYEFADRIVEMEDGRLLTSSTTRPPKVNKTAREHAE